MAHSIEARLPFLDYRLVEFAFSIPAEHKINGAVTKKILREAMKEYLPIEVYERKDKIGFSTPIEKNRFSDESWIKNISKQIKRNELLDKFIDTDKLRLDHIFRLHSLYIFMETWQ